MEWVVFAAASATALAGGIGVVATRQPVRSALALLLVLCSLAVLYLTLAAQFIAVLQVIIYAGAIVVLFLFVIMLIHARPLPEAEDPLRWQRPAALVLGAALLAALLYAVGSRLSRLARPPALPSGYGTAEAVGQALFTDFLLPFEVASVILLVGIVAAVVLGRRPTPQEIREQAGRETPRVSESVGARGGSAG